MRLYRTKSALALAAVIALAACGSDDPDADAGGGDAEGSTSTEGMSVAYASDLDPNDIADQIGIQAAGAETIELTEDSAVVAGLQNGNYDVGNIDITAAIKAIQAGVPVKIVYVSQSSPEFIMVSQSEITELSQLDGADVAFHSPGSLTEILQREMVRQFDPSLEDQIKWTVLPESPNRAAAMVADRIDATTLEFLDVRALQKQGDFTVLGSWADLSGSSGDAIATGWVVTEEYLAENRDQVVAFLDHVQDGYDAVYEDKDTWTELAAELLPDVDPEDLAAAYDYYVEAEMYPVSGTPPVTEERWAGLDEFFRQIGEYDQEAPLDMVDLEVVDEVNAS